MEFFIINFIRPNEVKFFALQVIEDLLRNNISSLSEGDKTLLKATFMSWIRDESSKRLSEPQCNLFSFFFFLFFFLFFFDLLFQ